MTHPEHRPLRLAALAAVVSAGACTVYSEDLLDNPYGETVTGGHSGSGEVDPGTGGFGVTGGGSNLGGSTVGGSSAANSGGRGAGGGDVGGASGSSGGVTSGGQSGEGGMPVAGAGGTAGTAGAVATAGAAGTAGMAGTGGATGAAGAVATGGAAGAGASLATGGAAGTAGTAGAGGAGASGATGATGGAAGTGGICSDTVCGSACADLSSSIDHCGACDRACSDSHAGALRCSRGVCASTCSQGWLDCNQPAAPAPDDGCETDGNALTYDCGGCGVACPRYQVCQGGCTVPCSGAGLQVLLVTGDNPPGASDTVVRDWLQTQLGFTVSVVDDATSQASDANGKALVVVSSTCDSPDVGDKFTNVAVPIVGWEVAAYDNWNMTVLDGWLNHTDQTELDVIATDHPLAAGLSGRRTVYSVAGDMGSAAAESSAAVVATLAGDSSRAVLFAYETGAAMYGGFVAPARRVGLPFRDVAPLDVTEDGERLGLVAFCWAAGLYP